MFEEVGYERFSWFKSDFLMVHSKHTTSLLVTSDALGLYVSDVLIYDRSLK